MSDDEERQERELQRVQEFVIPRLERAERAYSQALTGVWVANAGATLATLTFIGSTWQKGSFHRPLLVPLCSFVLGLISMGLGSAIALTKEARIIKRMERMTSVLEIFKFRRDEIPTEAEQAGLVLDWRTWGAIVSAGAFVLGAIAGLIIIAAYSPS